jgi:serine/threonine protein kinase
MAELFLSRDGQSGELRVIKRILPYLAGELEFVQMFLDEARIAAQLHHENIVQLYELGRLEDSIFIAMEFVDGGDVRKLLQRATERGDPVPFEIAAWIAARVCDGLQYAHDRVGLDGRPLEVVHRDISPQNVMLGFDGRVKLVDFGLARAGALIGKFHYLSPEQLGPDPVDRRADLFALGTLLYELTTGRNPFFRPSSEEVIRAVQAEDPPPPHQVLPDYPAELSRIVMKCLSRDRERRYQQAGEVAADLDRFVAQYAPVDRDELARYVEEMLGAPDSISPPRPGPVFAGLVGGAALVALSALVFQFLASRDEAPAEELEESIPVRFEAQLGTTIQSGGINFVPGLTYQVAQGALSVSWRCANGKSGTTVFSVEKGPKTPRGLPISCRRNPAK